VQGKLGDCFEFDEIEKLAEHFIFVLDRFIKRDDTYFSISKIEQEFSARLNADRLANLFLEVKK
jgi:hypothetical protein